MFWKTKHIYTIIEYHDGTDNQVIVIDFDNNVNYAQGLIYKKMLECRKTKSNKLDSDTSSHSPIRNTAEIKKLETDTSSHSPIRF